jgi:hypothetical protein
LDPVNANKRDRHGFSKHKIKKKEEKQEKKEIAPN